MLERAIGAIRRGYRPEQAEEAITKLREVREILGGDVPIDPNNRPRHFFDNERTSLLDSGYVIVEHSGNTLRNLIGQVSPDVNHKLRTVLDVRTPQRSIAFHPQFTEVVPENFIDPEDILLYFDERALFLGENVQTGNRLGEVFLGTPRDYLETVLLVQETDNLSVFGGPILTSVGVMTVSIEEDNRRVLGWALNYKLDESVRLIPLIQPKSK